MFSARVTRLAAVVVVIAVFAGAGCATMGTNQRQMTLNEVITMSRAGTGDSVIERQISATHSKFKLTSSEIASLKQAGVSDNVIESMIRTDEAPRNNGYYPYHYGTPYPWYDYSYDYPFMGHGYREVYPYYIPRAYIGPQYRGDGYNSDMGDGNYQSPGENRDNRNDQDMQRNRRTPDNR